MFKGKCIYCKKEKILSREHAFPKSLLQKDAPGWVIDKHLCKDCNSDLGKLDVVLSQKSHIAYVWNRVKDELGVNSKDLFSSIYYKRSVGVNPLRVFFPDPLYDDLIILHEPGLEDNETRAFVYSASALQPQIIITQYTDGQTGPDVVAENREKFNTIGPDDDLITDYDEQDDVYCIFGNTYILPPKTAERYFGRVNEFKSKFITDFPQTRYDVRVIYPEEGKYMGKVEAFYNALQGETKEIIEGDRSLKTDVFSQSVQAIPDRRATKYITRAIAKIAFHCFLYHYREFTGHEPMFEDIKDFINKGNGNPESIGTQGKNPATEALIYDSTEHRHYVRFFVKGDNIGCMLDFFTGLSVGPFSYGIVLSGDPDNASPNFDRGGYIPYSVHPKSQMNKRILPRTEFGIIQKPRPGELLWLPKSTRNNDASFYNNRGIDYGEKGEHDLAIKDFTKAIELKPDYALSYNNRGAVYRSKGEYDLAIEDCNKAIELKPDYAEPYSNRGAAYRNKGDYERAIEDYDKAIQLKPNFVEAYYNRGLAYHEKGELDLAIKDYSRAIELNSKIVHPYYNRGNAYYQKRDFDSAIEDYSKAIELQPEFGPAYCNRGEVRLHLKEWDKVRSDLTAAKNMGVDIVEAFHNTYKNIFTFERRNDVKLPKDIVAMLTQYSVNPFTTTQKIVTHDGKTQESAAVLELLEKFRNAGKPLREYLQQHSSRGITTGYNEAFILEREIRDVLIAEHPSSAEILKPFLMARDIQRWRVKPTDESRREAQDKWLIWTHRGIDINAYPAIKKHLEKSRDALEKRSGKQEWYEIQTASTDTTRFTQPKCIYADMASETAFAFDDEGYYVGNPASLLPTSELWILGVLNTRAVSWFYARTAPQIRGPFLKFTSRYVSQIPIPDMEPEHRALIHKFVEYILYLKKQPTVNSSDLKHARDAVMVGYFGNILNGLVYELYLPDDLHRGGKYFFQPLLDEKLPQLKEVEEREGDKIPVFRDIFDRLYDKHHPVAKNLYFLDSVKPIRIIESKA